MVASNELPPQDYLLAIFRDKGDTISWKFPKTKIVTAGEKVLRQLNGYYVVSLDGRVLLVHRVLFKMRHGYEPPVIDHVNGHKLDNSDSNLRACTVQQNTWNSKILSAPAPPYSPPAGVKPMSELTPAKTALQRAHEINVRHNAERLRLSNAINQAVALVAMLVLVAASFAYFGAPQMQHWVKANQENYHVSR